MANVMDLPAQNTNGSARPNDLPQQKSRGKVDFEKASSSRDAQDGGLCRPHVVFDLDRQPAENARHLGEALAPCTSVFRNPSHRNGLLKNDGGRPYEVTTGKRLNQLILDYADVDVIARGELKSHQIPSGQLEILLGSDSFLSAFPPLDAITSVRSFDADFKLQRAGYNSGPPGFRIFLDGPLVEPSPSLETIYRFLDIMPFASESDRTAAVAAALTVLLRFHLPGGKPMILARATKSQAGKDTILDFVCGPTRSVPLTFQIDKDWPIEKNVASLIQENAGTGVIRFENVRLDGKKRFISSPSIERFITTPSPVLYTTGSGRPTPVRNAFVVCMSTNDGHLSEDFRNRSCEIMLSPKGDLASRKSPIGDPRSEFLPANALKIQAELLGIVERWNAERPPLDMNVNHTFKPWAQMIGGMLLVSGFKDFLANEAERRVETDPIREALAFLGFKRPNEWLRPGDWALAADQFGVAKELIPPAFREGDERRATALGKALKARVGETFVFRTDDEVVTMALRQSRHRLSPGTEGKVAYQFEVTGKSPVAGGDE